MLATLLLAGESPAASAMCSVKDYPSIQAAIDANPGQIVFVPAGDYLLSDAIVIAADGAGLFGPGRLIQQNPQTAVVRIRDARHVRVNGLTLTRSSGSEEADNAAIEATQATDVIIESLHVLENHAQHGAITLIGCRQAEIRNCHVENYSRIAVDDRTNSPDYGYAFHCIDGTGIVVKESRDVLIQGNRIVERNLLPTPEIKEKHQLGQFVRRNAAKGPLISQEAWDAGYVNNWHQGSGLLVSSPEETEFVRIVDNHIENAAQGIDIHADRVTISGNMVVNAFMGMKAMHGSRNVVIANNQFVKCVLWAIGLMPGAASKVGNEDGDSIIASNIISEFGYGDSAWIWPSDQCTCVPIKLDRGQKPENPPLRNVVISGNVVSEARDGSSPRYKWAVLIAQGPGGPENIIVGDNSFPRGTDGVSNHQIPE